jgi:hypothetical protein
MSHCCEDPTEPSKVDPRDLRREQERYGNLVRDLFTESPEKVMLRELKSANTYLRELAALRAHYDSVRIQAIELLDNSSTGILERIIDKEGTTDIGIAAQQKLEQLRT